MKQQLFSAPHLVPKSILDSLNGAISLLRVCRDNISVTLLLSCMALRRKGNWEALNEVRRGTENEYRYFTYRSYVNRQHFLLRSFASLCLHGLSTSRDLTRSTSGVGQKLVGSTNGVGWAGKSRGGRGIPYNSLYGEAPPERSTSFRLQVYEKVGISQVEVYKRVGKSVI